uniref:Uncharacterized protein n=1 Tax=Lotharella oceanica TaxID=641309 RepID=A0A7S2TER1_9EUKA
MAGGYGVRQYISGVLKARRLATYQKVSRALCRQLGSLSMLHRDILDHYDGLFKRIADVLDERAEPGSFVIMTCNDDDDADEGDEKERDGTLRLAFGQGFDEFKTRLAMDSTAWGVIHVAAFDAKGAKSVRGVLVNWRTKSMDDKGKRMRRRVLRILDDEMPGLATLNFGGEPDNPELSAEKFSRAMQPLVPNPSRWNFG